MFSIITKRNNLVVFVIYGRIDLMAVYIHRFIQNIFQASLSYSAVNLAKMIDNQEIMQLTLMF